MRTFGFRLYLVLYVFFGMACFLWGCVDSIYRVAGIATATSLLWSPIHNRFDWDPSLAYSFCWYSNLIWAILLVAILGLPVIFAKKWPLSRFEGTKKILFLYLFGFLCIGSFFLITARNQVPSFFPTYNSSSIEFQEGDAGWLFSKKIRTLEGGTFDFSQMRGKVIFMDFWATWCPGCINTLPRIKDLEAAFGERNDFHIFSVSLDQEPKKPRKFVKEKRLESSRITHLFLDNPKDFYKEFGMDSIPFSVIIFKNGRWKKIDLEDPEFLLKFGEILGEGERYPSKRGVKNEK